MLNETLYINQQLNYSTIIDIYINKRKFCKLLCKCGKPFIRRHEYIIRRLNEDKTISCGCQKVYTSKKSHHFWKGYNDISGWYFSSFKCKAQRKKIPFEITIEQVWEIFEKQNKKCKLSGVNIFFAQNKKDKAQTASIDRIDSSRGYTIDNIQLVHKTINLMKNRLSQSEFIEWCKLVNQTNL